MYKRSIAICLVFKEMEMKNFDQNLLSTLCTLVTKGTGVEKVNKAIFQIIQNSMSSLLVLNNTFLL